MSKKKYTGKLKKMTTSKIYLNVNNLNQGDYILKIVHRNKVIKKTTFKKK